MPAKKAPKAIPSSPAPVNPIPDVVSIWADVKRDDFYLWCRHNPAVTDKKLAAYKEWREANPEVTLAKLPPVPRSTYTKANKSTVPEGLKSEALKTYETQGKISSGRPTFHVYRKRNGRYHWCGYCETNSPAEIAESYGGGTFEVRRVDTATGFEQVGPGLSVEFSIDPAEYPEKGVRGKGMTFDAVEGAENFGQDDIEEAEARGREDAKKEAELNALRMQVATLAAGGGMQKPASEMDTMLKLLELQRAMTPAPTIGLQAQPKDPMEVMAGMMAGLGGLVTTGLALYEKFKSMAPAAPAESTMSGRLLEKAIEALPQIMQAKAQERAAEPEQKTLPQDTQPKEEEMQQMYNDLAMEIAKQQAAEFNSSAEPEKRTDSVAPMARYILEQRGLSWNMLRMLIGQSPADEIVAFIQAKGPSLADTDWKRSWLKEVVEVVKKPSLMPKE